MSKTGVRRTSGKNRGEVIKSAKKWELLGGESDFTAWCFTT